MKRFFEHLIFWLCYWIIIGFFQGLYDLDFGKMLLSSLTHLPLTIITTYTFVYLILPLIFKRKILFVFYSVLLLCISVILRRLSIEYIQFPLFFDGSGYTFVFWDWYRIGGHIIQTVEVIGIVSGIKYYRNWSRNKDKIEELTKEKKEAELSFLKAQVHPHFLFNTLNSIYYEALNKSDKTAELIVQLSELLRFILYECKDDFIDLGKELKIIENYIAIEKSRYGNRLKVNSTFSTDADVKIPPLLLFSVIENSFKHGISDQRGKSEINISIIVKNQRVILNISNPISKKVNDDALGAKKGIGLKNTRRQLEIIYNHNYTLENEVKDNIYFCSLEIPIFDK